MPVCYSAAGSHDAIQASGLSCLSFMEPLMRKSLVRPRTIAYTRQSGRCFYCGAPMWSGDPKDFAAKYRLSLAQARFLQCTGEHLQARREGGSNAPSNIAAACRRCNQRRHQRKNPPPPALYKVFVQGRVRKGLWHDAAVLRVLIELSEPSPHRRGRDTHRLEMG
jgi:5-methylcytosine-specific restriction endonuclease McrA